MLRKVMIALGLTVLALIWCFYSVSAQEPNPDSDEIRLPYEAGSYVFTAGCHPERAWMSGCPIDLAGGKGTPLFAPITGNATYTKNDGYGNTMCVIMNKFWKVILLHGNFPGCTGKVTIGQQIGTESNHGYVLCWDGKRPGKRDCGHHSHIEFCNLVTGECPNPLNMKGFKGLASKPPEPVYAKPGTVDWQTVGHGPPGKFEPIPNLEEEIAKGTLPQEVIEYWQVQYIQTENPFKSYLSEIHGSWFALVVFCLAILLAGRPSRSWWPLWLVLMLLVISAFFWSRTKGVVPQQESMLPEVVPTETAEVIFPKVRQALTSEAAKAEAVIFPNPPAVEEAIRNPQFSGNPPKTAGNLLPVQSLIGLNFTAETRANIQVYYDEIVRRSAAAGVNPAFVMAIWIEESGASDYKRYPTVADFGCIYFPRANFDAQLNCFLSLWGKYETRDEFRVCRGEDNLLSMREFLLIYEGGFKSCKKNRFTAEPQFPRRIQDTYRKVTGGTELDF